MKTFKLFPAWAYEEEERWLNSMAQQGWQFQSYTAFQYHFDRGEPGTWQYALELLPYWPGSQAERSYLEFLEGSGIQLVDRYLLWGYFRRKDDGTPFETFSDLDGRLLHLNRVLVLMAVALVFLLYSATNFLPLIGSGRGGWGTGVLILLLYALPLLWLGGGLRALWTKRRAWLRERGIRE